MDGFDMGSTEIPGMEDMPNMDEGIEVGRDNNWNLGFNASMPIVNAALWKSLSISAVDVELAIEQARSSKIAMVNQVKKGYYGVLLANDSYRVFKESYDNAMENYLDIKHKFEQGTVAEYVAGRKRTSSCQMAIESIIRYGSGHKYRMRRTIDRL